jgi:hypothetical protein
MMEYIKGPDFVESVECNVGGFGFFDEVTTRKSEAQKAAEYALYWIEEAIELQPADPSTQPSVQIELLSGGVVHLVINGIRYGKD